MGRAKASDLQQINVHYMLEFKPHFDSSRLMLPCSPVIGYSVYLLYNVEVLGEFFCKYNLDY